MSNILEQIQGLITAIISLVANLIAVIAQIFVDIGNDQTRPPWIRFLAILICLAVLAGLAWLFWDYILVFVMVMFGLLIIASWFSS